MAEVWLADWAGVADVVQSVIDKCHFGGRVKWCHVAPRHLLKIVKGMLDSIEVDLETFDMGEVLWAGRATNPPTM
jgi:hypothetical protein